MRARGEMWDSVPGPWDYGLSQRQPLHQLNHSGALYSLFLPCREHWETIYWNSIHLGFFYLFISRNSLSIYWLPGQCQRLGLQRLMEESLSSGNSESPGERQVCEYKSAANVAAAEMCRGYWVPEEEMTGSAWGMGSKGFSEEFSSGASHQWICAPRTPPCPNLCHQIRNWLWSCFTDEAISFLTLLTKKSMIFGTVGPIVL